MSGTIINLSDFRPELKASNYHGSANASQEEALAKYFGFITEDGYADIVSTLKKILKVMMYI